ncbi:MAG: right-handed parallel beta-helix repeat-containing protein, partial [Candidatus Thorarchaeota archaeon]
IIKDIIFSNSEVMGINIDDCGENSRHSPAHHIIIENCEFYDINPTHTQGSGIKMAGVDDFEVRNCTFQGVGHNGIDFVGCHDGYVVNCRFMDNLNANDGLGVQYKGGSRDITTDKCIFKNLYLYGVSIGQSTSPEFFRPPCGELDADGELMNYESKNCNVYRSIFINVGTPIRWSCAKGGKVYNNTIYCPKNDYLRPDGEPGGIRHVVTIHQDHMSCDGSTPLDYCQGGEFRNNIIYFGYTDYPIWVQSEYTLPETFVFSNDLWYCWVDEGNSMPDWNYLEGAYGSPQHYNEITGDPLFSDPFPINPIDFLPQGSSPAIGTGLILDAVLYDFLDRRYADPPVAPARTVGSFERIFGENTFPYPPQEIEIEPN